MKSFLRRLTPTHPEWIDGGAAAALVLVALVGFRSSYGGIEFFVVGAIGVVVGLVVGHLLVTKRPPVLVAIAAVALVYLTVGGGVALRDRAAAGFVPNWSTTVGAARAAVFGWKELITTNPPVGNTGTLMALPFLGGFAAALVSYLLMRRLRFHQIGLIPAVVLLGVTIITGVRQPVSLLVQGGVFGAAAIGWLSIRDHQRRPRLEGQRFNRSRTLTGALVLVAATALGSVVAPHLPFADASGRKVWRETITPPFDPRQYPSPLSAYRSYVKGKDVKDAVMFTIEGLPDGTKIRLATMDRYDGLVWRPNYSPDVPTKLNSGYFERMGTQIASDFPGKVATITVTIGNYSDVWVPDVGEVLSLRFQGGPRDDKLNEALRYNRETDTAASRIALTKGDRYVMRVRLPTTLDKLAGQVIIPDVPVGAADGIPASLDKWAATPATLSVADPAARIDLLKARLIAEGAYSDGDQTQSQAASQAGHSSFRLNAFVETQQPMRGNAEQYASALALMLRDLDRLPSRVVMGFVPPEGHGAVVQVTGKQVEAWVEVPVRGVGWVAISPTPKRDETALKTKSPSPPEPEYKTQVPPPPPVVDPQFDQPATSKTGAKDTRKNDPKKTTETKKQAGTGGATSVVPLVAAAAGGIPLGLIGLATGIILVIKARRRSKRRRSGPPHLRMANGWREVTDAALDMGRPVPDTSTRREAARFVGSSTTLLAERADAAVFGPGEPGEEDVRRYWEDLEQMVKSMHRELGPFSRVKAKLSTTSLWTRAARSSGKRARKT